MPMDDVGADGDEQVPASVEKAANEGKKNVKFHIVMVGAVAYAAMLLSNWVHLTIWCSFPAWV